MKKTFLLIILLGIIGFIAIFLVNIRNEKILISTTLYPYAWLARQIVGNDELVRLLIPEGAEPHEYEPSPHDVQALRSSSIVIINGGGIDPWAEELVPELRKNGTIVIVASEHERNPHVWLDPIKMKNIAKLTMTALSTVDSVKQTEYKKRAAELDETLNKLNMQARSTFSSCTYHKAVIAHDAFSPFGDRYGITFMPASGLSHEDEPSIERLNALVSEIRTSNLPAVFADQSLSPKIAETLSRETETKVLFLDPIEQVTFGKETYISRMKKNISALQKGLQCFP